MMKATFNSSIIQPHFGFGNASFYITSTARRLGMDLPYNDKKREFQIAFNDPGGWTQNFSPRSKYRVGYFAWESTEMRHDNWMYGLNFCDEIWVPNRWNKQIAEDWGYEGKITVFPHGVSSPYFHEPVKRRSDRLDIVNFGVPAARKGSVQLADWFADSEFANTDDASLTFKVSIDARERAEKALLRPGIENIRLVTEKFTNEDNVRFMKRFNLHIYPSMGEGFGLMPLETMATGMPTIVMDGGWCDYSDIQKEITYPVPALGYPDPATVHPKFSFYHPGKVFPIDIGEVDRAVTNVVNNLEDVVDMAYDRAPIVERDWSWDRVVTDHFAKYESMVDFAF
jgi:glycosyltransferase involved in cell wall biosynthesis